MSATLRACRPNRVRDLVNGPDVPLDDHSQLEAGATVGHEKRGQVRLAEPHAVAEACHARLGDLELGLTNGGSGRRCTPRRR